MMRRAHPLPVILILTPLLVMLAGCPLGTPGSSIWSNLVHTRSWSPLGSASFAGGIGQIALAPGPGGIVSAVYFDGGGGPAATAMQFNGTSWGPMGTAKFAAFPNGISTPSAAADSSGTVYAAFENLFSNQAEVWKFPNPTNWGIVGGSPSLGLPTSTMSLAIDSLDFPYVAFSDGSFGGKVTVKRFSGGWFPLGAPGFTPAGTSDVAIAIDNPNAVYVAFETNDGSNKISVMKYTAGFWGIIGSLDFAGSVSDVSIAIHPITREPYVGFKDFSSGLRASVWRFHLGTWIPVGNPGFSAGSASGVTISFDSNGTLYAGYQDAGVSNGAAVKQFDGTAWTTVGVPGFSPLPVWYVSFAIDSQGSPIFGFSDLGLGAHAMVFR